MRKVPYYKMVIVYEINDRNTKYIELDLKVQDVDLLNVLLNVNTLLTVIR